MKDEWKEYKQDGDTWTVEYFEVTVPKDNEVIVTKHGMKIKVVHGRCLDCMFRVNRGMIFCDCRGEVPDKYLVQSSSCNLVERKFIKIKADKGL